ncbi:glycosyltransferase [Spirosoma sp. HMF3257]|uniref:Glycosyltransferase family 4 protein n=1 Tax=Spirosoma telluris TaxID=2183553 RepID=A0A327NRR7_9BACT|nr:glycosyltransferase [Spirosoma telluris]RAI78040.1 hypothetical protein HMF3257_35210 [Spirosoma telluris]
MKKKRIAFIVNGGIGGGFGLEGNRWFIELCEEVAKEYDLVVFSLVNVVDRFEPKGYNLIGVPFEGYTSILIRFNWLSAKVIYQHFLNKFHLIHAFWAFPSGTLAMLVGKLLGLKTILTFAGGEVTNIPSISYGQFRYERVKKIIKFTSKNVDVLIAPSNYQARKIRDAVLFKRLEVIPFGIDLKKFPVIEKPLHSPYQFIYVGDINKVKDLPTLIRTFTIICHKVEARLAIMGLDTLNGEIQAMVRKLNLTDKITFHGRQLNSELTFFLRKAHVLLHTSLSDAQIVAVNEALASGVAVCGTRVGLIDDLEDKITIAVPVGDADWLAEKVLTLLENQARYKELIEKGVDWSKENDLIAQSRKYSQVYQSLIGN